MISEIISEPILEPELTEADAMTRARVEIIGLLSAEIRDGWLCVRVLLSDGSDVPVRWKTSDILEYIWYRAWTLHSRTSPTSSISKRHSGLMRNGSVFGNCISDRFLQATR